MPYKDKQKDLDYKREYYKKYNALHKAQISETQRKYREGNREKIKKANDIWRKNNPEKVVLAKKNRRARNKEKINEQKRALYQKDKEKILAAQRAKAWYKTPKGQESTKKWRENNKEKILINNRNRKAALKNSQGKITLAEWESVKEKYGNRCLRCSRTGIKLTMDHVIPIKLGGSHTVDNIQPLCSSCNSIKNVKIEDYR